MIWLKQDIRHGIWGIISRIMMHISAKDQGQGKRLQSFINRIKRAILEKQNEEIKSYRFDV